MKEFITDILDSLALLLIAVGIGAYTWQWFGWLSLCVVGVLLAAGSYVVARLNENGSDDE